MAKRITTIMCPFCLKDIPKKIMKCIVLPMTSDDIGKYRSYCCDSCIDRKKDKILEISEVV
jgi:hypothetical protein